MRKVKPTIKVPLICLLCLFTFNIQAQKPKTTSSNSVLSETKKNLADRKDIQIDLTQAPIQPSTHSKGILSPELIQQLEVINNAALAKAQGEPSGLKAQPDVVVNYNPEPVSMTLQQLQQIRLNNGIANPIQLLADLPNLKSAVCGGTATFDNPSVCSNAPNTDGNIEVVVDAITCDFLPEVDNGDGTLTVNGLNIFADPNGTNILVGTTLESTTLGTTACPLTSFMIPANTSCAPTVTEFASVTATFIIDATTGDISGFVPDDECVAATFTITVNPNLTAQIIDDQAATCGTLTAALFAEDGTQCPDTEATAACQSFGQIPSIEFNYPYQACPSVQVVTGESCASCLCSSEVDYEDVVLCGADDDGDGVLVISSLPASTCRANPPIDNGDGTITIYGFKFYRSDASDPSNFLFTMFYQTAGSSACMPLNAGYPVNMTCDPITYTFEVVPAFYITQPATGAVFEVIDEGCGTEVFSTTIYPVLTAGVVSDETATCGTLTAALFSADGTQCPGTEVTSSTCNTDSETVSVTLNDPFGCADTATLTLTSECSSCPVNTIPTVSEWGLIILGLLTMITGVISIRSRKEEEIYA